MCIPQCAYFALKILIMTELRDALDLRFILTLKGPTLQVITVWHIGITHHN